MTFVAATRRWENCLLHWAEPRLGPGSQGHGRKTASTPPSPCFVHIPIWEANSVDLPQPKISSLTGYLVTTMIIVLRSVQVDTGRHWKGPGDIWDPARRDSTETGEKDCCHAGPSHGPTSTLRCFGSVQTAGYQNVDG